MEDAEALMAAVRSAAPADVIRLVGDRYDLDSRLSLDQPMTLLGSDGRWPVINLVITSLSAAELGTSAVTFRRCSDIVLTGTFRRIGQRAKVSAIHLVNARNFARGRRVGCSQSQPIGRSRCMRSPAPAQSADGKARSGERCGPSARLSAVADAGPRCVTAGRRRPCCDSWVMGDTQRWPNLPAAARYRT